MTTEVKQEIQQKLNRAHVQGMRRQYVSGRAKPFLLGWVVGGARKWQGFATEDEREDAAAALAEKREEFGREILNFDPREWRVWLQFKEKVGGVDPLLVAHEWLNQGGKAVDTITVAAAVEKYMASRAGDGLARGTMYQMKKKLGRLVMAFGTKKLHEVTSDALHAWMMALPFAPWTVKDHIKVVAVFWGYARRYKWCTDDPTEAVKAPKIKKKKINILTVEEARKLFKANRRHPVVGRLALEAFGALRFSSAGRLVAADLKRSEKGIELPGAVHKSGERHYIDGLPDNLWAWLKVAPAGCWEMTERQYLAEKTAAFIRAGVESSPNCLRHSFGTYHVAAFKDAGKTAVLMQHTSPTMLYRHYKGQATQADGLAYFKIKP